MANSKDEPAVLAHQCYLKKDYTGALQHLNELEGLVCNNSTLLKRVQHNKAVVEFEASEMKNIENFKKSIMQYTGFTFPEAEVKDLSMPCLLYNYAVILYHSRYYYQCTVVLEKLLTCKNIKDIKLLHRIVLLLLEATLCRRTYDKAMEIAKIHGEALKTNNEFSDLYERLVTRAQLYLGQSVKLKPDSIENIFLIAHQKYINGDIIDAANTLGQYKTLKFNYDLKTQGEDIWAAINNNLGAIYLSIKKPFLASKYFQHAVKEHFRAMESEDSEMLIACKDRPLYVYNLGLALLAANNSEGAFECLVEAARHYPNNPRIWLRLAECCVKKCCSGEAQQFTVKKLGSGPHTRILLSKDNKEKYSTSGESFAIPSLSLEFAALCLRNAITLIPDQETVTETATIVIQAPPGPPINWKQRCDLKNSILVLQSYIFLHLQDPLSALMSANELLSQPDATNDQKAWAHIYAAEALINLDKIVDAVDHLHPPMIHDLVSGLPYQMRDMIAVCVWAKAAVCHILRGDLITARKIMLQINSPRVLPLQMYLEICTGVKTFYGNNMISHLGLREAPRVDWCKSLRWRVPPSPDVVALVSFPGSGNTWLRYLLQQVTGIVTGSIYMDYGLRNHGFPAENVTDGSVLVVKTHEAPPLEPDKFKSAILLIRNPRDAILADFNRLHKGHIGTAPKSAFKHSQKLKNVDWPTYVTNQLTMWESLHRLWLHKFLGPIHIVFYEMLVRDTRETLRGILNFLNYTVSEEDMNCAIENREGIYRRIKKYPNFDPFTPEMYLTINKARYRVLQLVSHMKRHNFTSHN
ncbi:unnamed protein product, partial [Brenthis ino]